MDKDTLVNDLEKAGHLSSESLSRWKEASTLLAVFDAIGRDGANAMVKVDGSRSDGSTYTVVVSGGKLGEAFFRKDGANLQVLLEEAASFYRTQIWSPHRQRP